MSRTVVKQRIRDILVQVSRDTRLLENYVYELDNTSNECDCDDRRVFNFSNVSTEEMCILCISCGGYIEPKDLEDCGMF